MRVLINTKRKLFADPYCTCMHIYMYNCTRPFGKHVLCCGSFAQVVVPVCTCTLSARVFSALFFSRAGDNILSRICTDLDNLQSDQNVIQRDGSIVAIGRCCIFLVLNEVRHRKILEIVLRKTQHTRNTKYPKPYFAMSYCLYSLIILWYHNQCSSNCMQKNFKCSGCTYVFLTVRTF